MTAMGRSALAGLLAASVLLGPRASATADAQPLTITGYQKVNETRITRTLTEFTYRASLTNTGPAIPGATAAVTSLSPATTVVEGLLTFGPVPSGATALSLDTFTFRHDRTVPFAWSLLQWSPDHGRSFGSKRSGGTTSSAVCQEMR